MTDLVLFPIWKKRKEIRTNEISSSGCTNLIVIPEDDSGFLMVGAADIVWLAEGGSSGGALCGGVGPDVDEYAGNVGFTGGGIGADGGGVFRR